jgi:hypothetical protein
VISLEEGRTSRDLASDGGVVGDGGEDLKGTGTGLGGLTHCKDEARKRKVSIERKREERSEKGMGTH